ncbi:MAG: hypothetical protein J6032_06020, partial [Bacteroidales bacterium]|nr:hypothetical protein [Bacteroidales bacterium]
MLLTVLCTPATSWAQADYGNVPETVSAADASITKLGHLTMTMEKEVVTDPQTSRTDTLVKVKEVEWNTKSGTAQKRMKLRKERRAGGTGFEDKDTDWWLDMWWFTFN